MNFIKKVKWAYIVISALMITLGILLIIYPETSALSICYAVGILTIIFGIVKIMSYFSKDIFQLAFQFDFAFGILAIITGLILILCPGGIIRIFPIIIGGIIFVDGVFKLQTAYEANKFGLKYWWLILFLAILCCICGLFLIFYSYREVVLTVLIGWTLIIDGIQNLWVAVYTVKEFRSHGEIDNIVIDVDIKEK